jgi:hypothetical protein
MKADRPLQIRWFEGIFGLELQTWRNRLRPLSAQVGTAMHGKWALPCMASICSTTAVLSQYY